MVISHDRALLSTVSTIVEMTDQLRVYGGDFDDYEAMVAAEEEAKLADLGLSLKEAPAGCDPSALESYSDDFGDQY
mgnify:CR=1 FL=1